MQLRQRKSPAVIAVPGPNIAEQHYLQATIPLLPVTQQCPDQVLHHKCWASLLTMLVTVAAYAGSTPRRDSVNSLRGARYWSQGATVKKGW